MKAFDKWWDGDNKSCNDMTGHFNKMDAEAAWKAALGWVKDIVVHQNDGPSNPKDLILCIEQELANESTDNDTKD